jgi:hypothetical protein
MHIKHNQNLFRVQALAQIKYQASREENSGKGLIDIGRFRIMALPEFLLGGGRHTRFGCAIKDRFHGCFGLVSRDSAHPTPV